MEIKDYEDVILALKNGEKKAMPIWDKHIFSINDDKTYNISEGKKKIFQNITFFGYIKETNKIIFDTKNLENGVIIIETWEIKDQTLNNENWINFEN